MKTSNQEIKNKGMKSLTIKDLGTKKEIVAQCCAKKSKIISGCHD